LKLLVCEVGNTVGEVKRDIADETAAKERLKAQAECNDVGWTTVVGKNTKRNEARKDRGGSKSDAGIEEKTPR